MGGGGIERQISSQISSKAANGGVFNVKPLRISLIIHEFEELLTFGIHIKSPAGLEMMPVLLSIIKFLPNLVYDHVLAFLIESSFSNTGGIGD